MRKDGIKEGGPPVEKIAFGGRRLCRGVTRQEREAEPSCEKKTEVKMHGEVKENADKAGFAGTT